MIELTRRQRCLARLLCRRDSYVTTAELARSVDVSERTIRNELNVIESYVATSGATLERVTGKGIRLVCDSPVREALLAALDQTEHHTLSREERNAVAEMLLIMQDIVTFQDIADACRVSRQTIMAHFADVEAFFARNGLETQRDQGIGLHVEGREIDIRRCFLGLVSDSATFPLVEPIVLEHLDDEQLEIARAIIGRVERFESVVYPADSFLSPVVAFALTRIAEGRALDDPTVSQDSEALASSASPATSTSAGVFAPVSDDLEDPSLKALVSLLCRDIASESECVFLATVMLSQHQNASGGAIHVDEEYQDEASAISRGLISALRELHMIDDDSLRHLIDALTMHIRALIYRYRNGNQIQSVTPVQIMSSIPLLYDFTRKQMCAVEREYGFAFNECEIAYIAMYLDTIYETSARELTALKVLFVCSFGLATSSILMMRLSHVLADCQVFGPMTIGEAHDYLDAHEVDLVISTNEFHNGDTPVLIVDPLLNQSELEKVKAELTQGSYAKVCTHFLHSYVHAGESAATPHAIRDFVRPSDIQVGVTCTDWREAIRIAAVPLLARGVIERRYVDRMIVAVEDFGPYMVLTPGTAYVHAGVNDGIRENCIAICVLEREIPFGPKDEKRIKTIVVLGVRDRDHSDLLNLAPIFEHEDNIHTLESAGLDIATVLNLKS